MKNLISDTDDGSKLRNRAVLSAFPLRQNQSTLNCCSIFIFFLSPIFFFFPQTETHTENKPHTLHIKTPNTHYKTSTRAPTWTVCISVTRVCTFLCVHGITFLNERHRMPEACFLAQMKHLSSPWMTGNRFSGNHSRVRPRQVNFPGIVVCLSVLSSDHAGATVSFFLSLARLFLQRDTRGSV